MNKLQTGTVSTVPVVHYEGNMRFRIELGGVPVEIHHQYPYVKALCRDYMTDKPPALSVSLTDDQLEEVVAQSREPFSAGAYESLCLHREIIKALLKSGIILIHSAVIALDGKAYVFMAKSGVGKSTHISLWRKVFGERAIIVNGDKPLFSFNGDVLMAHGSPWRGKEGWGAPLSVPVAGICLLERGTVNSISPASDSEVVDRIFHQVLVPKNAEDMNPFMAFMDRLLKNVPFYRLTCNMEEEAALVAYEGMKKGKSL